jgi:hypothetical protein
MIREKFLGYIVAIFFLSYSLIIFQFNFAQDAQGTVTQPPSVKAPPFIIARATGPSWTQVNFKLMLLAQPLTKFLFIVIRAVEVHFLWGVL